MNTLKILTSFIIVATNLVLYSCSNEETPYNPMMASTISNTLVIAIEEKDGTDMDVEKLLANGEIAVFEEVVKREALLRINDSDIHPDSIKRKMLEIYVNLPERTAMTFIDEKQSEGTGKVKLQLKIRENILPLTVTFKYTRGPELLYGGDGIYIESVEYAGKSITPSRLSTSHYIKLKYNAGESIIEPLPVSQP